MACRGQLVLDGGRPSIGIVPELDLVVVVTAGYCQDDSAQAFNVQYGVFGQALVEAEERGAGLHRLPFKAALTNPLASDIGLACKTITCRPDIDVHRNRAFYLPDSSQFPHCTPVNLHASGFSRWQSTTMGVT